MKSPAIEEPTLTPEQQARRHRINMANQHTRERGRWDLFVHEDVSDERLEEVERVHLRLSIDAQVPQDTPDRESVLRLKLAENVVRNRPAGFLSKLFAVAAARRSEADTALAAAQHAASRAAELQATYESLKGELKTGQRHLSDAVSLLSDFRAQLAVAQNDEEIATRMPNYAASGALESNMLAHYRERIVLERAVADMPRIVKILEGRVLSTQAKIAALERVEREQSN